MHTHHTHLPIPLFSLGKLTGPTKHKVSALESRVGWTPARNNKQMNHGHLDSHWWPRTLVTELLSTMVLNCTQLVPFMQLISNKGVALTGCHRTGPPCSVNCPTTHAPGRQHADHPHAQRPTGPHTGSVTDDDDSQQNNTGPLGGPIIIDCSNIFF